MTRIASGLPVGGDLEYADETDSEQGFSKAVEKWLTNSRCPYPSLLSSSLPHTATRLCKTLPDRTDQRRTRRTMLVHLLDGTYELFRFHYARYNRDPTPGSAARSAQNCAGPSG